VEDQIIVDPNVYPSLWMYSGGPLLQAMSTFPDYELRIDGTAFSGFINGGVTFESGSAIFSGNYSQVLDVGVSVLTRDPSLRLVIEGHTDDRGSDAGNLALSQLRAEAVRDYFIANGIDASRLTAIGVGEAEPVVPNDSEEGRARNRRIQYVLTTST
jgi:outer membrane protein OmpA-like peptidoglycan-associated protein